MTTPTPISNPAETPPTALPGLNDVAHLAQLANQFFRALPGADELPVTGFSPPRSAASAGASGLTLAQDSPRLVAAHPPADAKAHLQDMARLSALQVPEGYAAALPLIPAAGPHVGASLDEPGNSHVAHYFLEESTPRRPAVPPDARDFVVAQPYALPGQGALRALLSEIGAGRHAIATDEIRPASSVDFYFLEPSRHSGSQGMPSALDVAAIRRDFPIIEERVNGRPLVWFDNAATTQKPQCVIDRLAYFYAHENSNIHRAAHELAARATDAYEAARSKVQRFLGASSPDEIIFVRGATEAINLVAKTWGVQNISAGDEIILSLLEHHANIVPWQQLAEKTGARIRVIPVDDSGQLVLDEYRKLLNSRTRLVSVTQVSNALGTVTPVREIIAMAHAVGAKVLVDGAQSVSHMRVNVQALDADFFVFSGHKVFGPTGIGVVFGKKAILDEMPPWQGGGNMIADVTFERTIFQPAPQKFEAGTGNIADAVGLGAALDYVERIGLERISRYEHDLLAYATQGLSVIPGVRLIGTAAEKASVASFVLHGYSTEEVGRALNVEGIAVRSGHHCAQPILRRFGLEATVRPSLAFYNTCEEVDRMLAVVRRLAGARR